MTTEPKPANDRLAEDMKAVMRDMEELLKVTAGQTDDNISAVRTRVEENLNEIRSKLNDMGEDVVDQVKAAARATDHLVRENPWQSIAVAAAVAYLLGMLTNRR